MTYMCSCPQRPEESVRSLGIGVIGGCMSPPSPWLLGNKLRSSGKTVCVLDH